jgi:hypothetical protein
MSLNAVPGDKFVETTVEQHRSANEYPSIEAKINQISAHESGVGY